MHHRGTPRYVALCGSLRDESRTRIVTRTILDAGTSVGADTELLNLRSFALPPLHTVDSAPADADRLGEPIDDAGVSRLPAVVGAESATAYGGIDE